LIASEIASAEGSAKPGQEGYQRVWDIPVRAMHWLLVVSIAVCWWTGLHDELEYHLYSGYAALWIALMRLYWGVVGSSTARFSSFVRGPGAVLNYARTFFRRDSPSVPGHNPFGALSVILMLGLVLAVVISGLFAVDVDGLYSGPLSSYVSFREGRHLAHLHYRIFNYLLAVIALHLLAVVFYLVHKRHNLLLAMISGRRKAAAGSGEDLKIAPWWRFLLGAGIVSLIVWLVTAGFYLQ
jgi:cytochrome b